MLDNKTNMYCEVTLVKTALYQYRMNIVNGNKKSVVQIIPLKSKEYYNVYIQQLACSANITPITKYLDSYCNENDDFFAFSKKVVLENEIKLKEFNFKVLHGILACNKNLKIWKIRLDDRCDVCNQIQTIEHLLFGCHYVKPLLQIVNTLYGINITFHQILGLDKHFKYDSITTIICFIIYKEWLLLSLDGKHRHPEIALEYFKNEIAIRLEIYKQCDSINEHHKDNLENLIANM